MKYLFPASIVRFEYYLLIGIFAFLVACSDAANQAANSSLTAITVSNETNASVLKEDSVIQMTATGGTAPYIWSVDNENGQISVDGVLTGITTGKLIITAKDANGNSGYLQMDIISKVLVLESIEIFPKNSHVNAGSFIQFTAEGTYTDQITRSISNEVTWTSSDPSTVSFSATENGKATASLGSLGDVTIAAELDGQSSQTLLTVVNPIVVTATNNATSLDIGQTLNLLVTGGIGPYLWSVDNNNANISDSGVLTGVAVGNVIISVTDSIDAVATIKIDVIEPKAVLQSINVTPANSTLFSGRSKPFVATGTYSDSSSRELTADVDWGTSNQNLLSFSATVEGLATAAVVAVSQSVEITATIPGSSVMPGSTTVTIEKAPIITVSTTASLIRALGEVVPFTANGGTAPYSWQVSDTAFATMDDLLGMLSPLKIGLLTVIATDSDGFTGNFDVAITGPLLTGLFSDPILQACVDTYAADNGFSTTDQIATLGLYCNGSDTNKISQLSGIENLTNLLVLELEGNAITDISTLSALTNLTSLNLSDNQLSDFSGLASLNKLITLRLGKNIFTTTTDLSALSSLVNLERLYLVNATNNIDSPGLISNSLLSINNLSKLKNIDLTFNQLMDLSFLKNLIQINDLQLSSNSINSIVSLSGLTNMVNLDLSNNNINNLAPIGSMKMLEFLNVRTNKTLNQVQFSKTFSAPNTFFNLKKLNIGDTGISDISALSNLTSILTLSASNNKIEDISVLNMLGTLTELDLSTNSILEIAPLATLSNLYVLNLRSNSFSDLSPLAGLINLTRLDLSVNSIDNLASFSVIDNMPLLSILKMSNMGLVDIPVFYNLNNLTTLRLEYNFIIDVTPLSQLISLQYLYLNNNNIGGLAVGNVNQLTSLSSVKYLFLVENPKMSCDELSVLVSTFNINMQTVVSPGDIAVAGSCTGP